MKEEHKSPVEQQTPLPAGERSPETDKPAQETGPKTRSVTPGQQKRRQRSVFQYIAILFGAAFVLLLLTFFMERRQYQLLNQQNEAQIDDLQQSVSAVQSLTNLYEENAQLKEKTQALEEENQTLEEQVAALEERVAALEEQAAKSSQALDWFWQIDEAYVRGRYSLCRQLMESLEEAGLQEFLPRESVTDNGRFSPYDRYVEIRDALN